MIRVFHTSESVESGAVVSVGRNLRFSSSGPGVRFPPASFASQMSNSEDYLSLKPVPQGGDRKLG